MTDISIRVIFYFFSDDDVPVSISKYRYCEDVSLLKWMYSIYNAREAGTRNSYHTLVSH